MSGETVTSLKKNPPSATVRFPFFNTYLNFNLLSWRECGVVFVDFFFCYIFFSFFGFFCNCFIAVVDAAVYNGCWCYMLKRSVLR